MMLFRELAVPWLLVAAPGQDGSTTRLDSLVAREFAPYQSGGVVVVARHGRPILRRAYGLADIELGVAMRPEHAFKIGSITKQFTAVAVLQLARQGRLSLEDDVRKHLPAFNTHNQRITIEQVLTHTSGLPTLVDLPGFETMARQDHSVAELLELTRDVPLHFVPGTSFRYSDTGYILLGAIIERVSGMSYGDYIATRLAGPLGMRNTRASDDAAIYPGRAKGYTVIDSQVRNATYISMTVPHAAGALASTADDLLIWHLALRDGRVVPAGTLARAWQGPMLPDGLRSGYGFGFKICTLAGRRSVSHGGLINGFSSTAIQLPGDSLDIVVLVNNDSDAPDAGRVARRIARYLLTGSAEPPYVTLSASQREALAGVYEIGAGDLREIIDSAGALFTRRTGVPHSGCGRCRRPSSRSRRAKGRTC